MHPIERWGASIHVHTGCPQCDCQRGLRSICRPDPLARATTAAYGRSNGATPKLARARPNAIFFRKARHFFFSTGLFEGWRSGSRIGLSTLRPSPPKKNVFRAGAIFAFGPKRGLFRGCFSSPVIRISADEHATPSRPREIRRRVMLRRSAPSPNAVAPVVFMLRVTRTRGAVSCIRRPRRFGARRTPSDVFWN